MAHYSHRPDAYVSSQQNYDDDFYWTDSHCLALSVLAIPGVDAKVAHQPLQELSDRVDRVPVCICLAAHLGKSIKIQ